jgi:hypothetical protein
MIGEGDDFVTLGEQAARYILARIAECASNCDFHIISFCESETLNKPIRIRFFTKY